MLETAKNYHILKHIKQFLDYAKKDYIKVLSSKFVLFLKNIFRMFYKLFNFYKVMKMIYLLNLKVQYKKYHKQYKG